MEIILTFIISIFCGLVITHIFESILKTNKKMRKRYYRHHEILFGYHAHHSVYGLVLFAFSILLFVLGEGSSALIMSGTGIGIILMHTISEGRFVFVEKQKL